MTVAWSHAFRQQMVAAAFVTLAHVAAAAALMQHPADEKWKVPVAVTVSLVSSPVQEHVASPQPKPLPPKKTAPQKARVPEPLTPPVTPTTPAAIEEIPATEVAEAPPAQPADEPYVEPLYDAAYLKNDPPAYPLSARRRGVHGTVIVRAEIGTDGQCSHAVVQSSSGHSMLDDTALKAVRGWRFVPAKRGAKPMAAWVEIPIVFKLTS